MQGGHVSELAAGEFTTDTLFCEGPGHQPARGRLLGLVLAQFDHVQPHTRPSAQKRSTVRAMEVLGLEFLYQTCCYTSRPR
jgi:hypothetical protein